MKVQKVCQECGKPYQVRHDMAYRSKFCSHRCLIVSNNKGRAIDYTGQHFGRWTAIRRVDVEPHRVHWLCRCECGTEKTVLLDTLLNRTSTSCGCYHAELNIEKGRRLAALVTKSILPGTRFTRLTVVHNNGINKYGSFVYLCHCDCGAETTVPGHELRNGKVKSCGCYKNDLAAARLRTHGQSNTPWYKRWRGIMRRDADIEWTNEMTALLVKMQPVCIVCHSSKCLTIDHVRPVSKGFALRPGNAVVLCKSCNSKKNNRDLESLPREWQDKIKGAASEFETAWNER